MARLFGGWVYMMANRRRGTLYVGVTSNLLARVARHREGQQGSFCERYGVRRLVWYERHTTIESAIAREKALKNWKRAWKIRLIEEVNPEWVDMVPFVDG